MDIDLFVFELIAVTENLLEEFYLWKAQTKLYLVSEFTE